MQKGPHLAIRYLFTVLKMWNFLKNTQFSTLEQYRLPNFKLGPIVHPRNHLSIWKLDFSFYDHSQILVIKCNHGQKPLWYIRSELTVQCVRWEWHDNEKMNSHSQKNQRLLTFTKSVMSVDTTRNFVVETKHL